MSRIEQLSTRFSSAKSFVLGFGLAIGFVAGTAFQPPAAGEKVGYIEIEKVISEMPEAKPIKDKLEKEARTAQSDLEKMQKEIKDSYEEYERKKAMMRPDEQKKKEEELQGKMQQLQQQGVSKREALQKREAELLKPVEEKISKTIEKIAQAQGYSIILNKGGVANTVLYGDKSNNLTFKLIDALK
jgi:outer membrane protein